MITFSVIERKEDAPGLFRSAFWAKDGNGTTVGCASRVDGSLNWVMAGRLPNGGEFQVEGQTAKLVRMRFLRMFTPPES